MCCRLKQRRQRLSACENVACASYLEALDRTQEAIQYLQRGMELCPENSEYKSELHRLQLLQQMEKERDVYRNQLNKSSSTKKQKLDRSTSPLMQSVDRRNGEELAWEDFYRSYALPRRPVIITGIIKDSCLGGAAARPWTFAAIQDALGAVPALLSRPVADSVSWAQLEPAQDVKLSVGEFIAHMLSETLPEPLYLHDFSFAQHCPSLAAELTIPKFFAGDFLQHTACDSLYRDSWPSLFVGPKGSCSQLHIDAFKSNFWMALFQGRKKWVFFPPEQTCLLYPRAYPGSLDLSFPPEVALAFSFASSTEAKASGIDSTNHLNLVEKSADDLLQAQSQAARAVLAVKYPLSLHAQPYTCELQPGEILFVPAGTPHYVANVDHTLALSANYIDTSNFEAALGELRVLAGWCDRSQELLAQLDHPSFLPRVHTALAKAFAQQLAIPKPLKQPLHFQFSSDEKIASCNRPLASAAEPTVGDIRQPERGIELHMNSVQTSHDIDNVMLASRTSDDGLSHTHIHTDKRTHTHELLHPCTFSSSPATRSPRVNTDARANDDHEGKGDQNCRYPKDIIPEKFLSVSPLSSSMYETSHAPPSLTTQLSSKMNTGREGRALHPAVFKSSTTTERSRVQYLSDLQSAEIVFYPHTHCEQFCESNTPDSEIVDKIFASNCRKRSTPTTGNTSGVMHEVRLANNEAKAGCAQILTHINAFPLLKATALPWDVFKFNKIKSVYT